MRLARESSSHAAVLKCPKVTDCDPCKHVFGEFLWPMDTVGCWRRAGRRSSLADMSDEFRRKRKLTKCSGIERFCGWGTWIRTGINGVRVRSNQLSTVIMTHQARVNNIKSHLEQRLFGDMVEARARKRTDARGQIQAGK